MPGAGMPDCGEGLPIRKICGSEVQRPETLRHRPFPVIDLALQRLTIRTAAAVVVTIAVLDCLSKEPDGSVSPTSFHGRCFRLPCFLKAIVEALEVHSEGLLVGECELDVLNHEVPKGGFGEAAGDGTVGVGVYEGGTAEKVSLEVICRDRC